MSIETSEAARVLSLLAAQKRAEIKDRAKKLELTVQRQEAVIAEYREIFSRLGVRLQQDPKP